MFRGLAIVVAIVVGVLLLIHTTLSSGTFLRYLDEHPDPRWVPAAEYYAGQGYYVFQDLQNAATYFLRVPERYPTSPRAEEAYYYYLECLDDTLGISRNVLMQEDQKYLDHYAEGAHATIVRERLDSLRTGAI